MTKPNHIQNGSSVKLDAENGIQDLSHIQIQSKSAQSLVWRLVRGGAQWAVPLLILTAVILTVVYRQSTYRIFDDPLQSTITSLIASAEVVNPENLSDIGPSIVLTRQPLDERYQQALSGRYWMIADIRPNGDLVTIQGSPSLYGATLRLTERHARDIIAHPGKEIKSTIYGPDQEELRVITRAVILPRMTKHPVVMLAGADKAPARNAIRNFALLAVTMMIIITCGLLVAILTQVSVGLKPLFDLRSKVGDVRDGRAVTVEGRYPKEIQPLAEELNGLISYNKEVVERARTHVGNLAHALKTPLAVLLNEADLHKTDFSDVVRRQSNEMSKQVEHHLRRARAASRGQAIGARSSVTDVLEGLSRTLEQIYRHKNITFDVSIEPNLIFRGERRDLEEMAGNLLDNACKWTRSEVKLMVRRMTDHPALFEVMVSDNGPGLKPDDYSEVLKRGARLDEATPGSGMGLAIVDDLAQAYNGQLELGEAKTGGLKICLTLPCVREEGA